jgi:hypothetical protein
MVWLREKGLTMSNAKHWPLDEMLADMLRESPAQQINILPRRWAAGVLTAVGEHIAWGSTGSGYSKREVGWALVRVFGSHNGEKPLDELIQGYREALAYYANGAIPDDLKPETTAE